LVRPIIGSSGRSCRRSVLGGCGRGEPAAVAAHHLVHDHHFWIRRRLSTDVLEEHCALLGGCPRAERLRDREDVVVDRLGQADDSELVPLLGEEGGEVGGSGVRVVTANRVQHLHAVLDQLVSGDALRILALLDEAALDAVLDVGHLDARIANGRAAVKMQRRSSRTDSGRYNDRLAQQEALVAVDVADDFDCRVLYCIFYNQCSDR